MAYPHDNLGTFLHPPRVGIPGGAVRKARVKNPLPLPPDAVQLPPVGVGAPNPIPPPVAVRVGPAAVRPSLSALLGVGPRRRGGMKG